MYNTLCDIVCNRVNQNNCDENYSFARRMSKVYVFIEVLVSFGFFKLTGLYWDRRQRKLLFLLKPLSHLSSKQRASKITWLISEWILSFRRDLLWKLIISHQEFSSVNKIFVSKNFLVGIKSLLSYLRTFAQNHCYFGKLCHLCKNLHNH